MFLYWPPTSEIEVLSKSLDVFGHLSYNVLCVISRRRTQSINLQYITIQYLRQGASIRWYFGLTRYAGLHFDSGTCEGGHAWETRVLSAGHHVYKHVA